MVNLTWSRGDHNTEVRLYHLRNIGLTVHEDNPFFLLKETLNAVGLFYLVSRPGEVNIPHSEMEKACNGIINSREGHSETNPQR